MRQAEARAEKAEALEAPSQRDYYIDTLVAEVNALIENDETKVRPPSGVDAKFTAGMACSKWRRTCKMGVRCSARCRLIPCVATLKANEELCAAEAAVRDDALKIV